MPPWASGAEQADEDDRGEAGAGREPLAVAEPEDQQRHDDRPAPDPEEAAEDAGEGADRRQLPDRVVRGRAGGGHLAILEPCPPTPRRGGGDWAARAGAAAREPGRAAILTDVDGTLAPIVERAEDAAVPAAAREALAALSERYALVGCISGRRAEEARRLVGLDSLAYAGNHGLELLLPGDERAAARSLDRRARERSGGVPRRGSTASGSRRRGCGRRTRGRSRRCTGAAPTTRRAAESRAHEIANEAGRAGLEPRWGRKVLELRPVGGGGKDGAVASLLAEERARPRRLRRRRPHRPRRLPAAARAAGGGAAERRRLRRRALGRGAGGAGRGVRRDRRRPRRLAGDPRVAGG